MFAVTVRYHPYDFTKPPYQAYVQTAVNHKDLEEEISVLMEAATHDAD